MENTSKALIIVGTITLSVLIIGIGMYIYRSINIPETVDSTSVQMEIQQFNMDYEVYEGKQRGTMVKKLLSLATKNNQTLYKDDNNIPYCVCIRSNDENLINNFKGRIDMVNGLNGKRDFGVKYPSNIKEISDKIMDSKYYNISFNYNDLGHICEININTIN